MTDTERQGAPAPLPVRTVNDIETLRALSDPLRVAILRVLMAGTRGRPPVMSVKELANELGEPQTKLYRHVKHLEARGLIVVAQTRLVSGIVEHRYRTGQLDLTFDRSLISSADPGDQAAMAASVLDTVRNDFVGGLRSGRLRLDDEPGSDARRLRPIIGVWENTVSAERAAYFRRRLSELLDELRTADQEDGGIPVVLLAGMYSRPGPEGSSQPPATPVPPAPPADPDGAAAGPRHGAPA